MIAVIIPVHNEEELLSACLNSCTLAARDPALLGEEVERIVVLDACIDSSADIAKAHEATIVSADFQNVGKARALGAQKAIRKGARWLAFTDADSEVPPDWISGQLALKVDAFCGIVSVKEWKHQSAIVKDQYLQRYQFCNGHRHIHGANFGISPEAYLKVGGFPPLAAHEDVAIVGALERCDSAIAWVSKPCVFTSDRKESRVLEGFAGYLQKLESLAAKSFDKASFSKMDAREVVRGNCL